MVGMWLTVIVMFIFLMLGAYFFLFALTTALKSEDSTKVDPIPKNKH
ncbi:hypothetical protein [Fredinandcohnia quinoae]|uniref:ATP synthase F0 subunit 8 n=1 Tax=Fredinandcohnia quinoae TaxID=2918902 RepID=A0AAW5E657_9BACI|nr:hypothetical protein [Fredinandcohnia sp. SECRCQ15]MCH1624249.1 hypothetical protein [Fredinandcohnia sp. SECRCQ15]